ncbi:hypothetical protein MTO96_032022 [Rhipicephalus appendiculatus]
MGASIRGVLLMGALGSRRQTAPFVLLLSEAATLVATGAVVPVMERAAWLAGYHLVPLGEAPTPFIALPVPVWLRGATRSWRRHPQVSPLRGTSRFKCNRL